MGKPTPKVEVMKFLKSKQYTDSKDFAGECESVVMIAKGQSMQLTTFKCFPPANQKISLFKTTVFMIFSFFFPHNTMMQVCRGHANMEPEWITYWHPRIHRTSLFRVHTRSFLRKGLRIIT